MTKTKVQPMDQMIRELNSREWISVLKTPEELERLWSAGPYIDINAAKTLVIGAAGLFGRPLQVAES